MKTITIIMMYVVFSTCSLADIKNGFQEDVEKAKQAKVNLELLIDRYAADESALGQLVTQYTLVKMELSGIKKSFLLTGELIHNFQINHPALYDEIDNIKDFNGNKTDVYISILSEDQMNTLHWGSTNLNHVEGDEHTYQSRFGPRTVSVNVRLCEKSKCLRLLVHELGHVKYQVPNLASYTNFFKEEYKYARQNDAYGHKLDDPSNMSVIAELKRFTEVVNNRKFLTKNSRNKGNTLSADHIVFPPGKGN